VVLKDDKQATGPAKARAVREVSLNRESDLNCLNIQPGIGMVWYGVVVYLFHGTGIHYFKKGGIIFGKSAAIKLIIFLNHNSVTVAT